MFEGPNNHLVPDDETVAPATEAKVASPDNVVNIPVRPPAPVLDSHGAVLGMASTPAERDELIRQSIKDERAAA